MRVPEPVPNFSFISQGIRLFLLEEAAPAVSMRCIGGDALFELDFASNVQRITVYFPGC